MKRIFLTSLKESKLDWRLEHPAFMALKSAQLNVHGQTKKFTFPSNLTINIRPEGAERRDRYIMLNKNSYDIFTLIDTIRQNSNQIVTLEYDTVSHRTHLHIKKGWEVNLFHNSFYEVLGIGVAKNAWVKEGNYYGLLKLEYQPKNIKSLWLHCKNLHQNSNHLDGNPSDVFQIFPLAAVAHYHFENPTFLQLASSTDTLSFELRDDRGNDVDVESVIFELLIKEHGKIRH